MCRYGGEEFAILLPEVDTKGAVVLAEKTRKLVEKHKFEFDKQTMPVTISLGVSSLSADIGDVADLIRATDAKLYEAKNGGRNRVVS